MLILKRRENETVAVIDKATGEKSLDVIVVELRPGSVRIGFPADPTRFAVHRQEVIERQRSEGAKP